MGSDDASGVHVVSAIKDGRTWSRCGTNDCSIEEAPAQKAGASRLGDYAACFSAVRVGKGPAICTSK
jgi:hypothetical protein